MVSRWRVVKGFWIDHDSAAIARKLHQFHCPCADGIGRLHRLAPKSCGTPQSIFCLALHTVSHLQDCRVSRSTTRFSNFLRKPESIFKFDSEPVRGHFAAANLFQTISNLLCGFPGQFGKPMFDQSLGHFSCSLSLWACRTS